jgi:hypothetical protein
MRKALKTVHQTALLRFPRMRCLPLRPVFTAVDADFDGLAQGQRQLLLLRLE